MIPAASEKKKKRIKKKQIMIPKAKPEKSLVFLRYSLTTILTNINKIPYRLVAIKVYIYKYIYISVVFAFDFLPPPHIWSTKCFLSFISVVIRISVKWFPLPILMKEYYWLLQACVSHRPFIQIQVFLVSFLQCF